MLSLCSFLRFFIHGASSDSGNDYEDNTMGLDADDDDDDDDDDDAGEQGSRSATRAVYEG